MGISMWQLLIILVIVVLLFGTKKLKNIGGDLGGAVRGFKKAMGEEDEAKKDQEKADDPKLEQKKAEGDVIEGTAQRTDSSKQSQS